VQAWIGGIKLHSNSARQVVKDVSQVFVAAHDDGIISRNPLKARSVQLPKQVRSEPVPWTSVQIAAVAANLPNRLAALSYLGAGCGMRQGELFGAALDDLNFLQRMMRVEYQVRYVAGCLVFAPVKNGKMRDVPVPDPVIPVLSEHVRLHPPVAVTLPWLRPGGKPVTRTLLFTRPDGSALLRTWFNYAHFMPDDEARARKIMNAFFESASQGSCAPDVPRKAGE
jgi:integrase